MEVAEGETAKAPMLDEVGDPILTMAFNRLRVEGHGSQSPGYRRSSHHRLDRASEHARRTDWVVLNVVPETDFIGLSPIAASLPWSCR